MPKDTFPYKSRFRTAESYTDKFAALKKRQPTLRVLDSSPSVRYLADVSVSTDLPEGKYLMLEQFPEDYDTMNDFDIAERVRITCSRGGRMTPRVLWDTREKSVRNLARKLYGNTSLEALRDAIWKYRGADECGTFRPSVLVDIVRQFGHKRVLDISAGWGDRLIGAMAAGVSYVGTDPNTALQPFYKSAIAKYGPKNRRYTVGTDKFEDFSIPAFKFDAVITSPPYYDYEIYDHEFKKLYPTVSVFLDNFLVPSVSRAITALEPGGRAYIIINDTPSTKYCSRMVSDVCQSLGSKVSYRGVICYGERKKPDQYRNPQPIFVFERKVK